MTFVRPGTLDVMILKTLSRERMHACNLAISIEKSFGGDLRVGDPAVRQSVRRLEQRGLIVGRWGVSDNNRSARIYTLTARGRLRLRIETANWMRFCRLMIRFLRAE